ncbi:MAG: tRNA lysidine(34) synthetase TilS [Planctomycetes bacterium]|nr:tRNA lysidine(34) synthetase TilS [Planctomycetota bacterium]
MAIRGRCANLSRYERNMPLLTESIRSFWPESMWHDTTVLVAVSGGADSVALLHGILEIASSKTRVIVAHYNHATRGAESDGDRDFVRELAASRKLPFVTETRQIDGFSLGVDEEGVVPRLSEAHLRELRHRFLKQSAVRLGASWIATGHHADDCVETFLHHLLRGSGPAGLAAMDPTRRLTATLQLVRPLLGVNRSEIVEHLREHGYPFRNDSSNDSCDYTRNRIRNELLPWLRGYARTEGLDRRLWNASQLIREEHLVIGSLASAWLNNLDITADASGQSDNTETMVAYEFDVHACLDTPWPVVREGFVRLWHDWRWPLREMSQSHWNRIRALIDRASVSKHPQRLQLPGNIQVTIRRERMRWQATQIDSK